MPSIVTEAADLGEHERQERGATATQLPPGIPDEDAAQPAGNIAAVTATFHA